VHHVVGFLYAFKHQLRKSDPTPDLVRYLGAERTAALQRAHFRPIAVLNDIRRMLAGLHRRALISDTQLWMFDTQLNELEKTVGGCERIVSTPIPFAYGVLLHRTVYAYCMLLPFGLVDSIGLLTPLVTVFVSYTLIALEAIASEISEPFGTAPNSLALNAITRNIERSLLELCGEAIPEEEKPVRAYELT
jgi:ion channel-forming bestrophin family protein